MSLPLAARLRPIVSRASLRATTSTTSRCPRATLHLWRAQQTRTFLSLFKKAKPENETLRSKAPEPVLSQNDLFHPFSKSPFQTVKERGEAIKKLAPCPVCLKEGTAGHSHGKEPEPEGEVKAAPPRKNAAFECPDCGWPTHCSEEHWKMDEEHQRYCGRLKEANEDEHDLRSGRRMTEFEMPGPMEYDSTVSFSNWDIFWFTRGFPSMDTERMRRHASKLLTYPMTIASVLHQNSGLTLSNQRVTPEGMRSLAALRSTLHVDVGAPETEEGGVGKPVFRVFILGARAESSLPPHVWEQLSLLFPAVSLHLHFIGPQVSLPKVEDMEKLRSKHTSAQPTSSPTTTEEQKATSSTSETETNSFQSSQRKEAAPDAKPNYLPNVYSPPTPAPIPIHKRTRSSISLYGAPSYTVPYAPQISLTGIQAPYSAIHPALASSLDPYADAFFLFSPGLGFPSPSGQRDPATGEPLLQAEAQSEWGGVLPLLLQSKCPIFVTGFSPRDVERDVRALARVDGVAGEFDWVITPGENPFGSEKWEVADFDPRVMVKTNWGIWGIKGKRRDIQEI